MAEATGLPDHRGGAPCADQPAPGAAGAAARPRGQPNSGGHRGTTPRPGHIAMAQPAAAAAPLRAARLARLAESTRVRRPRGGGGGLQRSLRPRDQRARKAQRQRTGAARAKTRAAIPGVDAIRRHPPASAGREGGSSRPPPPAPGFALEVGGTPRQAHSIAVPRAPGWRARRRRQTSPPSRPGSGETPTGTGAAHHHTGSRPTPARARPGQGQRQREQRGRAPFLPAADSRAMNADQRRQAAATRVSELRRRPQQTRQTTQ